jgi:hypothetical protein
MVVIMEEAGMEVVTVVERPPTNLRVTFAKLPRSKRSKSSKNQNENCPEKDFSLSNSGSVIVVFTF